jgi:hypothetical protein
MNRVKHLLLATLACVIPLAHAAEPLTPDQFDWQQTIKVDAPDAAIYRFDLPASVHAGARRTDLGDIRIFNGAGEIVPHALINDEPPPQTDIVTTSVTFFPLRQVGKESDGSLSVSVRQIAGGALVSTQLSPAARAQARLVGYVVDASAIKNARRALILNWQAHADGTVLTVQVDGSDDLQTWRQLGSGTQLVDLRSGEQHLQHKRVDLSGSAHKYFRLRWPEGQEGIVVTSAAVETSSMTEPPDRMRWSAAGPVRPGSTPGEFLFESAAQPVAVVRLDLPQLNTVVPLQLSHRRDERDAWHATANTVAYRLMRNNEELRSPPIELCCSTDRYWRITLDQRGGGIGSGLPKVELGWIPQQGLFVARGPAPFRLAYGNANIAPAAFAAPTLIPGYRAEQYPGFTEATFDAPVARATPVVAPADEAHFQWRTAALWSVLIAGVLLLAVMVWRLLRQMEPPPGSNP